MCMYRVVCGRTEVIAEFEVGMTSWSGKDSIPKHHDHKVKVSKTDFCRYTKALATVFQEMGNHFNEDGDEHTILDTKEAMLEEVLYVCSWRRE